VHRLDSWIKIDQLDVTCFIISLFTAQHVSNASTSIFRSLRLVVDLFHVLCCSGSMCVDFTVWFGWGGVVTLCRLKHAVLLKMDVLTFEKWWAVNSEIIKQVTSSWSIFIQQSPVIKLYHKPHEFCPHPHTPFLFSPISYAIIFLLHLGMPGGHTFSGFAAKPCMHL